MKLLRLDLIAFGPFTDVNLDLAAGKEGLHIIYGPNEAGKSSSLRALRQLFFGIPLRCSDDFRHPNKNLRIGARLSHSDGTLLEVIRRKANANTLRGPDDSTVVEPERLRSFLGAIDQKLFETMFGIDHPVLIAGGKEIIQGGGHFGEVLFAASAGLSGLRKAQEGLTTQMRELFLPGGVKPRINQLTQEYTRVKKELKDCQLSHEEWSRHSEALEHARERKKSLEKEALEKRREQSRLTRIGQALKPIAARKQVLKRLEEYRDAPALREDFSKSRLQAQTHALLAARAAEDATRELGEIESRLSNIQVPEELLAQGARIEEVYLQLGAQQSRQKDRPERETQMRTVEHEAKEILKSLGQPGTLENVEKLRLTKEETSRIQNLGNEYQGLAANRDHARKQVETLARRIEEARRKLAESALPADPASLRSEVKQALKLGDPEEALAEKEQNLSALQNQITLDLARLPYWEGKLPELEKLSLPGEEAIQEAMTAQGEQKQRLSVLEQRLGEEEKKLATLEENIRRLELQQDVPTEEDLRAARERRTRGWRLVREAWQAGAEPVESGAFVEEVAPGRPLADAYEQSVVRADDVVDRLRREAGRVADKAQLIAQADGLRRQIQDLTRKRAEAASRLEAASQSWITLLKNRGLPALRLSEARTWIQQQAKIVAQISRLREEGIQAERLRKSIDAARQRLGAGLQELGEAGPRREDSLGSLLERAQDVLKKREAERTAREKTQENLESFESDLQLAQVRAGDAEQALMRWRAQWKPLMARLGLGADAEPTTANEYLNSNVQLFLKLYSADHFRRQIQGMDRVSAEFSASVRSVATQASPDLAAGESDEVAHTLQVRLDRARSLQKDRENLVQQREKELARLKEARQQGSEANIRLAALCKEAKCASPDELPLVEERSQNRKLLEKELHDLEDRVRQFSAGASVEEMVAEVERIDADALEGDVQRLEKELEELRGEISRVDQTIGSEGKELEKMNGNEAAAEAAAHGQSLLAQLQSEVPRYAALHLASTILKRAVDRYREKNQGPVLSRASKIFADLTAGSFIGLRIDYDDQDRAVLMGARPDDTLVGVAGMSDGSCDQLYLALRLATLEVWLESHEPIPFIVDDILLSFDDERSLAALRALADLSRRTQVIFFTHHQHLVDLAETHLDPGVVFYHRLPGRRETAERTG